MAHGIHLAWTRGVGTAALTEVNGVDGSNFAAKRLHYQGRHGVANIAMQLNQSWRTDRLTSNLPVDDLDPASMYQTSVQSAI